MGSYYFDSTDIRGLTKVPVRSDNDARRSERSTRFCIWAKQLDKSAGDFVLTSVGGGLSLEYKISRVNNATGFTMDICRLR